MRPRPVAAASYALPVRQAGTLPAASFRFRIAPDTLAVRLAVPITRACKGLSPPSHRPDTIPAKRCLAAPRAMPGAHEKRRLLQTCVRNYLAEHPHHGLRTLGQSFRHYPVTETPFTVVFEYDDIELRVLFIVHQRADRRRLKLSDVEW